MVLYCNFRSLPFLGFIGFLIKAAESLIYSYPPECSQVTVLNRDSNRGYDRPLYKVMAASDRKLSVVEDSYGV